MSELREDTPVAELDSDMAPSGDDAAALDEQADASTPADHDETTTEADESSGDATELIDEAQAPETARDWVRQTNKTVQKRLREAAQAKKEAERVNGEVAELRAQMAGFQKLLSMKNPAAVIDAIREQYGIKVDAAEEPERPAFVFKPSKALAKDPEADKELRELFSELGSQLMTAVRGEVSTATRPLAETSRKSEALVRDQEWGRIVSRHSPKIDQWRAKTEAFAAEKGVTLDEALLIVSKGESRDILRQRAVAADKAKGSQTPVGAPRGRSPRGASVNHPGGKRRLADYMGLGRR